MISRFAALGFTFDAVWCASRGHAASHPQDIEIAPLFGCQVCQLRPRYSGRWVDQQRHPKLDLGSSINRTRQRPFEPLQALPRQLLAGFQIQFGMTGLGRRLTAVPQRSRDGIDGKLNALGDARVILARAVALE